MDVRRDPATGEIAQAAGPAGCISGFRGNGCARARGSSARAAGRSAPLPGLAGVAVSPDGRNVYAAASVEDSDRRARGRVGFPARPVDRRARAIARTAGCIGDHVRGCAPGHAMDYARGWSSAQMARTSMSRRARIPSEIAVLRRAPMAACTSSRPRRLPGGPRGTGCVKLSTPRTCRRERTLVLSPDGRYAYIASGGATTSRSTPVSPTGALRPLRRCIPYERHRPCRPTDEDQAISLALSPDGRSLYLVEERPRPHCRVRP